ncbi:hypothetical protein P7C73_g5092, partial [Tremellales sp. Uapishka_1]
MSSLKKKLAAEEEKLENALAKGSTTSADRSAAKIFELQKQIKKEEKATKSHPALTFGPLSQTVSIMFAITMGLSVAPLPYPLIPFYQLFSRVTIVAVICLVTYTSIIYYGYHEALSKLPKEKEESSFEKFMKLKSYRPDLWAHTRSHPSQFLTTRHAPPRLFPFPLGKSRPAATVRDELWWEGGNAPHVGHFNKVALPRLDEAVDDESKILARVKQKMEMDARRAVWSKRINNVKILSVVVIIYFVHKKVAAAALLFLIYRTLSTELEDMLKPPTDLSKVLDYIDRATQNQNESAPRDKTGLAGGMTYLFDPDGAGGLTPNSNIPIVQGPAPVLMTSQNHYYAGPGAPVKKEG